MSVEEFKPMARKLVEAFVTKTAVVEADWSQHSGYSGGDNEAMTNHLDSLGLKHGEDYSHDRGRLMIKNKHIDSALDAKLAHHGYEEDNG